MTDPIKYIPFLPTDRFEANDESFRITSKIASMAADVTDEAIYKACIEAARDAGVTQLYLVDKRFVADAIREKLERENTAVPVAHGAWMDQDYTFTRFTCTACGSKNHRECTEYCPHCGARMDAKKDLLSEFSAHVASMSDDDVRASVQNAERLTAGCAREEE